MTQPKSAVLQGTLDLMVLKTLDTMGPMHGFGIAQRIQQVSEDVLQLNQGTLYPALLRLEQQGWIRSRWGTSENNRRARYYSLRRPGRKQLEVEEQNWARFSTALARVLRNRSIHLLPPHVSVISQGAVREDGIHFEHFRGYWI